MRTNSWLSSSRAIVRSTWGLPLVLATLAAGSMAPESCQAQPASGAPAIARWVPTGDLNVARNDHTATRLLDGRVLIVGGVTSAGNETLDSAELFDPATGTWSFTGRLHQVRVGHTATLLTDGRVLVAGGCDVYDERDSFCKTAELFDPATGTWSLTGRLAQDRYEATATRLENGKVLVATGGWRGAEVYDPVTGTWRTAGRMLGDYGGFSATLLRNGQVLIAGGWISSGPDAGPLATTQIYDPVADVWSRTGNLSYAMTSPTMTVLGNGSVLAVSGLTYPTPAALFDPSTGKWTPAGHLNTGRSSHTTTLLANGEVLVAAGWNGDPWVGLGYSGPWRNVSDVDVYDPVGGTWRKTASLSVARIAHTATLLADGRVLVAGGWGLSQADVLRSSELYQPGALAPVPIQAGHTGSWYNPAQNGHGFALEVLPGAPMRLLASWFTFVPQGGQSWITGVGQINGNQALVQAYQTAGAGGRFPPNFDAANVHQKSWGTLTFTFSDCNHGRVDWAPSVPGYASGGMDLTRLTLPAGLTCSDDNSGAGDWDY